MEESCWDWLDTLDTLDDSVDDDFDDSVDEREAGLMDR